MIEGGQFGRRKMITVETRQRTKEKAHDILAWEADRKSAENKDSKKTVQHVPAGNKGGAQKGLPAGKEISMNFYLSKEAAGECLRTAFRSHRRGIERRGTRKFSNVTRIEWG